MRTSSAACAVVLLAGGAVQATPPAFTEVTDAAGVTTTQTQSGYSNSDYTSGGCVADFNNDGWQDLFVVKGNGRDRLFINNGDGTFTDIAEQAGFLEHKGKGAVAGDFNGDGWTDIYVVSAGPLAGAQAGQHKLYRNNADGTFTNVAVSAGVNKTSNTESGFSAAFGDYDLDGDLDLFVSGQASGNTGSRLFRNNGDETFTDVTAASQFFSQTPVSMFAFTPRFIDVNLDFYPDMPLVSDFGTSRYFKNNGDGTFTDWTNQANLGQEENGMGGNVGDFNNDGLIDLYHSSIYFPSINWTGNKLYINQGNHQFVEIAEDAGVDDGGYGWGCLSVDFDHDGWLDILETNGGSGTFDGEQSYLWMNNHDDTFDEKAIASGISHFLQGRGITNFDYDNDGDQDVVIFANNDPIKMYRNDIAGSGDDTHWLRVFLDTSATPGLAPDGYGARVYVTAEINASPLEQMRILTWGSNLESSSEMSAHFGLSDAAVASEVRVEWPDGSVTTLANVEADQTITIASGCAADFNGDGNVNILDFVAFQVAFTSGDPAADCDDNGQFNILDFVCFQVVFAGGCD